MADCVACGTDNEENARFCKACGASLVARGGGRRQRKTVTVVFCDLVGSTSLDDRPHPLEVAGEQKFDCLGVA
jgi:class 3 adenylate cyclase